MTVQPTTTISRSRDWVNMTKPGIVVSNVMTAAAGLWLAPGAAGSALAVAALVGTGLLVAGSGAFNQVLERDTDQFMPRTRARPMASGRRSASEGVALGLLTIIGGTALLAVSVNLLSAILGLVATFIYVFIYTPLKRRTLWAVPVGAVSGALPPVMGWAAATGSIDAGAIALFGLIFWWQMPHFLGIALYRADDYRAAGLQIAPTPKRYPLTVAAVRLGALLTLASAAAIPFFADTGVAFVALVVLGALLPTVYAFRPVHAGEVAGWGRRVFLSSLVTLPLLALAALVQWMVG
ncbi:MAG: heme o synthase [Persicimonas sp.]